MAKLPKNAVFVYYYSENTGNAPYLGGTRVIVCKTFEKAYTEMEKDVNAFIERYDAEVLSQWVNDQSLQHATSSCVALQMPDGHILDLHIAPAIPF